MTGFGAGSAALPAAARVVCEARSVNARSLDVRVRGPEALGDSALWVEQLARKRLRRGRVEVTFRVEGEAAGLVGFDRKRAAAVLQAVAELGRELGYHDPPPLSLLASVPGMFVANASDEAVLRTHSLEALTAALEALDDDRAREGRALCAELVARANRVLEILERVAMRATELPAAFQTRLKARLGRLGAHVGESRVEEEIALLADRIDVAEEVSRLGTHTAHFSELCAAAQPESGRRLDFLLQEMMREATTLAAKAQDADISRNIVSIKVELDRMREQVQNVE